MATHNARVTTQGGHGARHQHGVGVQDRCMRSLRGLTSTSRQRNRVWHTTSTHAGGRKSPMEHGKRQEPDFEQPYDPFGERAYFKTDYWEANFYDEPDNTPVELYVESLKKSAIIDKLRGKEAVFVPVDEDKIEDALAEAKAGLQVVLVHSPWCKTTQDMMPALREMGSSMADADFFQVKVSSKKSSDLLQDVWLSPTFKVFKGQELTGELIDPTFEDLQDYLTSQFRLGHGTN